MKNLESIMSTTLLVPMGDPSDPDCIWGLPCLFWGSPGIGKSGRVKVAAKSVNLPMETIFPSTRAPEDFSGAPFMLKDEKVRVECILGAVNRLIEQKRGILFMDELSCAVPAVQAALLGVIWERRIGETVLPGGIRIISAANPPEQAAGGWELELPAANRFAHFESRKPTPEEWCAWLLKKNEVVVDDLSAGEDLVRENWKASWARATGLMSGYISSAGGDALYKEPALGNASRGRAWPSPRTWEMATRAVATCFAIDQWDLADEFVGACVGEGQAVAWTTWVKNADLPHPREMCTKGFTPSKPRPDRTQAALTAMEGFVLSQKKQDDKEKYAEGAWRVLQKVDEVGQLDIAAPVIKSFTLDGIGVESKNQDLVNLSRPLTLRLGKTGIASLQSGRTK